MSDVKNFQRELYGNADPKRARVLRGFFKTGKGEYGKGDVFLGFTVPQSRKLARKYNDLGFAELRRMLRSKFHEERLIALLILVEKFLQAGRRQRGEIFRFYFANVKRVNNWDLVDLSADKIVGAYLYETGSTKVLERLAESSNVWSKRIAIVATYHFIKNGDAGPTLRIAKKLLHDPHDLIQKAVGWMLREVGKRCSVSAEQAFLRKYHLAMPRTTLRYAIERFPEKQRRKYLDGKF